VPVTKGKSAWNTLGLFSIIFLIAGAFLFLVALAHYWQVTLKERTDFRNGEISSVLQGKTAIERKLAGVVSDINFLAAYGEHYQTRYGKAYSFFDDDHEQKRVLTRFLRAFSREKKVYDQIRFLDPDGRERIRINYNEGSPYPVAVPDLQEKSSRYYFQDIKGLDKDELYISPLDLNIENGEIEIPYKPVIRLAKSVFNAQKQYKGSVLLNVIGDELLQDFREATDSARKHIMLVNKDGYWISSPNKEQEWGFMFDRPDNFATLFPYAWDILKENSDGQINTASNLITYTTINPLPDAFQTESMPHWKVISVVPHSHPALQGAFGKYRFLYGSILLLLALGSLLLASTIIRHRQSKMQVAFEQKFRQVLERIDLMAVGMDTDGTIIFCNQALADLTGWKREDMLGKNWFELFVSQDHRSTALKIMHDLNAGVIDEISEDALIQTRDGELRKIDWNHTLMKDADGDIIGLTCIGENVTDIRAQEKQILTLSRAVEQSPVVVMIVDMHGKIQYVNPRFTEVTGYQPDEVIGKNPSMLRSEPGTESEKYENLWGSIRSGKTWHGIFKNRKKNGDIYCASASISALRDGQGEIVNYVGVQEDITMRRELESELEQRNREVARSKTLAIVGRMASMVAHDLRNPLSSIKMSLQILSKPNQDIAGEYSQELKKIALQQVGYMENNLDDLLNYARPPALKPQWLDFKNVMNETINMLQGVINRHQANVRLNIQTGLPTLYADPSKLRLIFSNLISNAIQAGAESGGSAKVFVDVMSRLGESTPSIQIEIFDNGPGINDENIEQLFEPFFTTRAQGTGLGLAIVKGFVEQHRGSINLHANPDGKGTVCTVKLPISILTESLNIHPSPKTGAEAEAEI
jgi:PAS domain S-box-containing protein